MIRSLILFSIIFTSCMSGSNPKVIETEVTKIDTTIVSVLPSANDQTLNTTINEYATYFVVIADTGLNYHALHKTMFNLNKSLRLKIDTLGRYYNKKKNLIALPDNDEDELYAGEYFPRRYPTENLSLEYLDFYQRQSHEKTIALMTGIYETENKADSALVILKRIEKNAFKIKADIYMGCMH